jgi:hypothetical protein
MYLRVKNFQQAGHPNNSHNTVMPIKPEDNPKPFKKGQSGNPNGRPKGRRNRATVVRQWLEVAQQSKNPITGETEMLEQQDLIVLAQIKAAREGSTQAFNALMDSADGKVAQRVEVVTPDVKNLPEWMR